MARPEISLTSTILVVNELNEFLVIKRKNEPFQNRWALPGGFLEENETFLQAAVRELGEETGIHAEEGSLSPLGLSDEPFRDPRGRVVDMVYLLLFPFTPDVEAADDATDYAWLSLENHEPLAFDHDQAVDEAFDWFS